MRDRAEVVAERVRRALREHAGGPADDVADETDDELPAGPRWRLDPGRGTAIAVGVAVVLAALLAGGWLLLQRPQSVPVSASGPASAGPAVTATPVGTAVPTTAAATPVGTPSAAATGEVVVDVAGKVHRPGLYRLPAQSRIDDAVRAAGGALRGVDLSNLNLAQRLTDGQQILVGLPASSGAPAAGTGPAAGGSSAGATATVVDLNTADLDQLETLPGVGPVLAQHILDWRTQHGSFTSVDQLDDVSGIGTVKFAALEPLVSV